MIEIKDITVLIADGVQDKQGNIIYISGLELPKVLSIPVRLGIETPTPPVGTAKIRIEGNLVKCDFSFFDELPVPASFLTPSISGVILSRSDSIILKYRITRIDLIPKGTNADERIGTLAND
jgi:hypothetical protein